MRVRYTASCRAATVLLQVPLDAPLSFRGEVLGLRWGLALEFTLKAGNGSSGPEVPGTAVVLKWALDLEVAPPRGGLAPQTEPAAGLGLRDGGPAGVSFGSGELRGGAPAWAPGPRFSGLEIDCRHSRWAVVAVPVPSERAANQ